MKMHIWEEDYFGVFCLKVDPDLIYCAVSLLAVVLKQVQNFFFSPYNPRSTSEPAAQRSCYGYPKRKYYFEPAFSCWLKLKMKSDFSLYNPHSTSVPAAQRLCYG